MSIIFFTISLLLFLVADLCLILYCKGVKMSDAYTFGATLGWTVFGFLVPVMSLALLYSVSAGHLILSAVFGCALIITLIIFVRRLVIFRKYLKEQELNAIDYYKMYYK